MLILDNFVVVEVAGRGQSGRRMMAAGIRTIPRLGRRGTQLAIVRGDIRSFGSEYSPYATTVCAHEIHFPLNCPRVSNHFRRGASRNPLKRLSRRLCIAAPLQLAELPDNHEQGGGQESVTKMKVEKTRSR